MRRRRDETYTRCRVTGLCDPRIDLTGRELSAFTRLCTLRHLDLDLFCMYEVIGSNTETSGSDLLDRTHLRIAVRHSLISFRILTAFTGVGLTAQTVHGDGQSLMCFLTDGTVGHSTCLKSLDDVLDRFYFVNGDRLLARNEFQKTSDRAESFVFFVQAAAIFLKEVVVTLSDCILQLVDRLRVEHMVFTVFTPLVHTACCKTRLCFRCLKCGFHTAADFLGDLIKADTADSGSGRCEILIDDFFTDTECFEDLCALVALDGGDTHLRQDLNDTVAGCFDVVVDCNIEILIKTLMIDLICDRRIGHIRVDRRSAVTDEQCKVMNFSRLTGLKDDGRHVTLSLSYEVLVKTGNSEQCRDRALIRIRVTVGQN